MSPVIIAAGGTGGHVFPAAALVEELRGRGLEPVVFTDRRAAERDFSGAERHVLAGAGIAGRGAWRGIGAAGSLAAGTLAARRLLSGLKPRVVVGFGGYPSVAPILAARTLSPRQRIVLHEQNAVLGRANRLLAPLADSLAISFAATKGAPPTAVVTGNPVRAAIVEHARAPYFPPAENERIRVLVFGGSLGARTFADLVPAALARLAERGRISVIQQCRPEDVERTNAAYAAAGISAGVAAFFPDLPTLMAATHLVVSRAGASTVAELGVIGRPALLVPLPGAIDDHQRANAKALAEAGAATVIDERKLSVERFSAALATLLAAPDRLTAMAAAAARFGRPDAGAKLAELVSAEAARFAGARRGRP